MKFYLGYFQYCIALEMFRESFIKVKKNAIEMESNNSSLVIQVQIFFSFPIECVFHTITFKIEWTHSQQ